MTINQIEMITTRNAFGKCCNYSVYKLFAGRLDKNIMFSINTEITCR